jgi:hypothetical protein
MPTFSLQHDRPSPVTVANSRGSCILQSHSHSQFCLGIAPAIFMPAQSLADTHFWLR